VISDIQREMLKAFSFPVALFLALPFLVMLVLAYQGLGNFAEGLLFLLLLIAPIYITGLLLSPWAGRHLPGAKSPAFVMSTAAASASAIPLGVLAAISGGPALSLTTAAIFLLFALPASLLGALLFIGGCERLVADRRE
jgi:hypothetical protein